MSIVISYYCDKFALIATDTMVTSFAGSFEDDKLYDLGESPLGYCAGVGLRAGIESVRDAIRGRAKQTDPDLSSILTEIQNGCSSKKFIGISNTVFSFWNFNHNTVKLEPKIIEVSINPEMPETNAECELVASNHFELFAPNKYISHPLAHSILEKKIPIDYTWIGDHKTFFSHISYIFDFVQRITPEAVSRTCDIGIIFLNENKNMISKRRICISLGELSKSVRDDNILEVLDRHTIG